ncbi:hypothetical protein MMC30_000255 [Trapelia coarctata]|nr:hypothetical protein [Trapelia coarctata]
MPPSLLTTAARSRFLRRDEPTENLRIQWTNPANILDLLLLVGGDVIQTALAQLTGDRLPTPMVFSFGWVAYAFMAMASAVGDDRLLRLTDLPSVVINGKSGSIRSNESWILGRILRDFESGYWMDNKVKKKLYDVLTEEGKPKVGLCVSFFEAKGLTASKDRYSKNSTLGPNDKVEAGEPAIEPTRDLLWWAGYAVAAFQLLIAAIPCIVWNEWQALVITICGTAMAFFTASLPEWRRERWAARRLDREKTLILTRGNGAQHALVVFGRVGSLDLEDLASSTEAKTVPPTTKAFFSIMVILWVSLLVTVDGLGVHSWFLIAVGGTGMLYTAIVAGSARRPENFGINLTPLEDCPVIFENKVMLTLFAVEKAFPGVGHSMLSQFFTGDPSPTEAAFWKKAKELVDMMYPPGVSSVVEAEAQRLTQELIDDMSKMHPPLIGFPSQGTTLSSEGTGLET